VLGDALDITAPTEIDLPHRKNKSTPVPGPIDESKSKIIFDDFENDVSPSDVKNLFRDLSVPKQENALPDKIHDLSKANDGIVLLVEDEAPVRAFASRALRMRGYTVLEAENAEEALKTLEDTSLSVDIFVTDVIMPGMDGPTWVTKALEERPGVKVVFVSGYAEDSVAEHQARIPNSVFLPKPFSLTDLTTIVQQQLL